jgi:allantoinase
MTTPSDYKCYHENDGLTKYGGRDLLGYGSHPPAPKWPKGTKVALNFVINYEEGGEKCLLHGDGESEKLLSEITGAAAFEGQRHKNMESLYDYGARVGFWRFHRLFTKKKVPTTVFAVGMALERNPAVCSALKETDWEVASHGYRWIDYQDVDEDTEREHIARSVRIHEKLLGKRPVGFYQGKVSKNFNLHIRGDHNVSSIFIVSPPQPNLNTRRLVHEEGGFKYDSDSYEDDLPYWTVDVDGMPRLIIPYSLAENDMKFTSPAGVATGKDFCQMLKETLK